MTNFTLKGYRPHVKFEVEKITKKRAKELLKGRTIGGVAKYVNSYPAFYIVKAYVYIDKSIYAESVCVEMPFQPGVLVEKFRLN